jgi:hypothetical protein
MAPQAIAHPHGHVLVNNRHRLHFTMASLAKNPGIHMRPVIEVDMIGQRVNSSPLQRLAGIENRRKLFNFRLINLSDSVAVHAFFHGGNSGCAGFENPGVAVLARDMKSARVKLMGKSNRLSRFVSADKPVRLSMPAHADYGQKHRCGAGR